jgi:hypothetical protein
MLVKTSPQASKGYGETVCCAGLDAENRGWVRMYPVNFRSLDEFRRFSKWQFIQAQYHSSPNDARPESIKVAQETITAGRFIPPGKGWAERREWLDPIVDQSLHSLMEEQASSARSLGVIRPRSVERLVIRPVKDWDAASRRDLAQLRLDWTATDQEAPDLEILPYDFLYRFHCDDDRCNGHEMEVFDWEIGETYRSWRARYGSAGWEAKFRQKWEQWLPAQDLHFVLGTHFKYGSWMIVGVLYPPHPKRLEGKRRAAPQRLREGEPMTLPLVGLEA